jgi:DNA repair protein RecO
MPTIRDHAVCLRRWEFSETSQTVLLLSAEHGLLRGLAKGALRPRGNFSGGFEPLTVGEIVASVNPRRDLATLTAWHLDRVCWAPRQSLAANRACLMMVDLTQHLLPDRDPHAAVYQALVDALDELDADASVDASLLRYIWVILGEAGYRPNVLADAQTGEPFASALSSVAFNARAGGFIDDPDAPQKWKVRMETVRLLQQMDTGATLSDADPNSIHRAIRLLAAYTREVIGRDLATFGWVFSQPLPA